MAAELYLTEIDELLRRDHSHLTAEDECLFIREYTSGAGFAHSDTNDLISNFKKPVTKKGTPEWKYKEVAVKRIAAELGGVLNPAFVKAATFVPMPPSKKRGDPDHDDRLVRMLRLLGGGTADVRELLVAVENREAFHTSTARRDIAAMVENLAIDPSCLRPRPAQIAIVDDILTTGAQYRAAVTVIGRQLPGVPLVGLFVARRVFPEPEP